MENKNIMGAWATRTTKKNGYVPTRMPRRYCAVTGTEKSLYLYSCGMHSLFVYPHRCASTSTKAKNVFFVPTYSNKKCTVWQKQKL